MPKAAVQEAKPTLSLVEEAQDKAEKVEANYSGKPLQLSMSDLIFAWEDGLINNASYIFLAMKLDGIGSKVAEDFNIIEFIDRWEGKRKRLTNKDVMGAIARMEKAGRAKVVMQMSRELNL
jgi:hypothetical protein